MLAKREGSVYGRRRVWLAVSSIAILAAGAGNAGTCDGLPVPTPPIDAATAVLLAPAPRLPIGFYDFFGELKTPGEARQMVVDANLDPNVPDHYLRIGLIHITEALIEKGRQLFNTQVLGEFFTLNNILSLGPVEGDAFGSDILELALTSFDPANDPDGSLSFLRDLFITTVLRPKSPTTNLKVGLSRDLRVGSTLFPAGTTINTGVDVAAGAFIPVGFEGGHVSCALCHTAVDPVSGREMVGAPNTDLWAALFIALTPNSAAVFLKLNKSDFDPMDPRFPKTGRRIIDSNGNTVQLPDPVVLETAVDDFLISVPPGSFDAGPDFSAAMTKMPDAWVFGEGGMGWDGGFNVGPFGGPTTFSNAVHSFELNLLSPANFS
ncbi:MAG: hypothetical protein O7D94_08810, partial [Planctomycetota bacterium]|nr:hypothetical protein [Planctomycetota bacterium]